MTARVSARAPATARLVVTMPPEPSRLAAALSRDLASEYLVMTPTTDAFLHLARVARERLTVMVPYVDAVGAAWAAELFEETQAAERVLVIRDRRQLVVAGVSGDRLVRSSTRIVDYGGGDTGVETFHAKIVLADGISAYVGSANLLRRSKSVNLECGILIEGPAVAAVRMLVDAVERLDAQL
jgi:phosphatidylserine/phosphatidylglycerophosphate/cardiolipin synthase-like enzyme